MLGVCRWLVQQAGLVSSQDAPGMTAFSMLFHNLFCVPSTHSSNECCGFTYPLRAMLPKLPSLLTHVLEFTQPENPLLSDVPVQKRKLQMGTSNFLMLKQHGAATLVLSEMMLSMFRLQNAIEMRFQVQAALQAQQRP